MYNVRRQGRTKDHDKVLHIHFISACKGVFNAKSDAKSPAWENLGQERRQFILLVSIETKVESLSSNKETTGIGPLSRFIYKRVRRHSAQGSSLLSSSLPQHLASCGKRRCRSQGEQPVVLFIYK